MVASAAGATRLLEQHSVLDDLRDALGEAAARRGRFVIVAGEAGVGKSAVVREFCAEARGSARVLWGGCDALFTPRPLGPQKLSPADRNGRLGSDAGRKGA
jgi:predicted ATPase